MASESNSLTSVNVIGATEDQQTKGKRRPGAALVFWRKYSKVSSLTAISFSQTPAKKTQMLPAGKTENASIILLFQITLYVSQEI